MAGQMTTYEDFVDEYAAKLDSEPAPAQAMGAAPAGATVGGLFRDAMNQIRAGFGAISWWKWAGVAAAVLNGIMAGKPIGEIVQDVIAALVAGTL